MADASFEQLTSARLILRRFRASDLDSFVTYRADPTVARYQSWENFTAEDGRRFIDEMAALHPDMPGQWFQIAIELKGTGKMIGDCALHTLADSRSEAEIGFTLAPAFEGRGYATEATACLLDYVFGALGKRRAVALTDARNVRSIAVLERLGFVRDPAQREPVEFKGEECREYLYVMERNQWRTNP
jgi:RimJ/RimL family protein N-acetyltransferase